MPLRRVYTTRRRTLYGRGAYSTTRRRRPTVKVVVGKGSYATRTGGYGFGNPMVLKGRANTIVPPDPEP